MNKDYHFGVLDFLSGLFRVTRIYVHTSLNLGLVRRNRLTKEERFMVRRFADNYLVYEGRVYDTLFVPSVKINFLLRKYGIADRTKSYTEAYYGK